MEKWKSLSRLPRVLLVLQAAMLVLFTILYPVISSREGILYRDASPAMPGGWRAGRPSSPSPRRER